MNNLFTKGAFAFFVIQGCILLFSALLAKEKE
jgi:hypothetical protein